jgi:hypothetical protein
VILIRDRSASGCDLALDTTDLAVGPAQVIERYAARWSVEVAIKDAKQEFGAGQARNRRANVVRRTVRSSSPARPPPSAGTPLPATTPADIEDRRNRAPRYQTKTRPATAGMTA